jgi:hypothetical protein
VEGFGRTSGAAMAGTVAGWLILSGVSDPEKQKNRMSTFIGTVCHKVGKATLCHKVGKATLCHKVGKATLCHKVGKATLCHKVGKGQRAKANYFFSAFF